jgi:hypothetical protein
LSTDRCVSMQAELAGERDRVTRAYAARWPCADHKVDRGRAMLENDRD